MPRIAHRRRTSRTRPYPKRRGTSARRRTTAANRRLKRYVAKKNYRNQKVVLYNQLVQPRLVTTMRYVDTKTLNPSAGAADHIFRLNSIFDPDSTGVGHQPAYHDQWDGLYANYRVLACKYQVTFISSINSTDASELKLTHTGATDTYPYIIERGSRKAQLVATEITQGSARYTDSTDKNFLREIGRDIKGLMWSYLDGGRKTLKGNCNIKEFLNDPDDFDEATAFGANPAYGNVNLHVVAMSLDGNDTDHVRVNVHLDYLVELTRADELVES